MRFDERNILFSRLRYIKDTKIYNDYYSEFKNHKDRDDHIRKAGANLLENGMLLKKSDYDVSLLQKRCEYAYNEAKKTKVIKNKTSLNKKDTTYNIKKMANSLGIELVGITAITNEDHYLYRGRNHYGDKINLDYKYAIVLAYPLNIKYINKAPNVEIELAGEIGYNITATVANQLEMYIKKLGYEAISDSVTDYYSPMIPLAVKSGLGQLGRCNLLVNPDFGNRFKIGAVLTNLPLVEDLPIDFGLKEFCEICKICARKCPTNAISVGKAKSGYNSSIYWPHDYYKCFDSWQENKTDCGICMKACPFTQGVRKDLVNKMKNDKKVMTQILKEHYEKHGK